MPPRKYKKKTKKNYVKNIVQNMLERRIEKKRKFHEFNSDYIYLHGAAADTELLSIAQGATEATRVGQVVKLTSLYAAFSLHAADSTNIVRIIFYTSKTDATMLGESIGVNDFVDPQLFNVLYDRRVVLSSSVGPEIKAMTVRKNFTLGRRSGIRVGYDGATSAPVTNAPRFYIVSDSSAVPHPTISGYIFAYFTDA